MPNRFLKTVRLGVVSGRVRMPWMPYKRSGTDSATSIFRVKIMIFGNLRKCLEILSKCSGDLSRVAGRCSLWRSGRSPRDGGMGARRRDRRPRVYDYVRGGAKTIHTVARVFWPTLSASDQYFLFSVTEPHLTRSTSWIPVSFHSDTSGCQSCLLL